ncbi:MAG: tripartite tricarboxylate transporter substrate binding protein [Betaproteobacteria bacterium]|nr:tripartite tricarboxylate transporter substrate binding protein [Betaproteobacteria bacterium]
MKRLLLAALLFPALALAQSFPTKPIRMVLPFGAGGVADLVSRTLAPKLSEDLGQQVVIENKPSAGGIVAANDVARSAPDGYTLLLITNGNAVSSALFKSLPYDPVNDFEMISTIGAFSLVMLTDPKSDVKNVQEVIASAKANPGKRNIATVGLGSTQHLAAELFKSMSGIDAVIIPYKATGEVVTAAKNRDAMVIFEFLAPSMSHIKSGNLRALAVTAGTRFAGLPDVPTVGESGLAGFEVTSWNGLAAPAKTPRAVIERLNRAVVKAIGSPEVQERFATLGVTGRASTPEHLREYFISEAKKWAKVVETAKIPKR